ncbi:MAG: hypothetical protein WA977_10575 [Halobacteriota archaeon]
MGLKRGGRDIFDLVLLSLHREERDYNINRKLLVLAKLVAAVVIFALIAIIASAFIGASIYVLAFLLMPPLIALLILSVAYKIGLIPKKGLRYCISAGEDVDELTQIFKRADKYVYAIGGELAHDIWSSKKVIEEIKKAQERGVEIKIICGPRFDIENFEIAKMANEEKISLFMLKNRETTHHFRINDKYDTLYHSGIDNRREMVVWFNNIFSGKLFVEMFNKKLEKATKIDKGKLISTFGTYYMKIDEMGNRYNTVNEDEIKKLSEYICG